MKRKFKKGFTLIETGVAVTIIAIAGAVLVVTLNPPELLRQSRDHDRASDLLSLDKALQYAQQNGTLPGVDGKVYVSIPDSSPTCAGNSLLPTGVQYVCAPTATVQKTDGTGWLPLSFTGLPVQLSKLPVDPVNTGQNYFTYSKKGRKYELTTGFESQKFIAEKSLKDGGNDPNRLEVGPDLAIYSSLNTVSVPSGLVSYWPLDGDVIDIIGQHNGTLGGGASIFDANKIGRALYLDGVDDYVWLGAPDALAALSDGPVSYSAWVYYNPSASWGAIIGTSDSSQEIADGIMLSCQGNPCNRWIVRRHYSSQDLTAETAIGTVLFSQWQHVIVTWDGSASADNIHIYRNAVELTHDASNLNGLGGIVTARWVPISIGQHGANSAFLNGRLDDIRIYNRVLSKDEVQQLYTAGSNGSR